MVVLNFYKPYKQSGFVTQKLTINLWPFKFQVKIMINIVNKRENKFTISNYPSSTRQKCSVLSIWCAHTVRLLWNTKKSDSQLRNVFKVTTSVSQQKYRKGTVTNVTWYFIMKKHLTLTKYHNKANEIVEPKITELDVQRKQWNNYESRKTLYSQVWYLASWSGADPEPPIRGVVI